MGVEAVCESCGQPLAQSMVEAVTVELESLNRPRPALVALALMQARILDDPKTRQTARSHASRTLLDTLERLKGSGPKSVGALDGIRAGRSARRGAVS